MAYMLPIQFIRIGPSVCISAARIVSLMSTDFFQARQAITREKRAGTMINGCGKEPARTAIFLDNGTVVSSPYTITRILKNLDKSNSKDIASRAVRNHQNVNIYQAVNEGIDTEELLDDIIEDELSSDDFEEAEDEEDTEMIEDDSEEDDD